MVRFLPGAYRCFVAMAIVAALALPACASHLASVQEAVREIEGLIRTSGQRSFVTRYANGSLREKYTVRAKDASYVLLDSHGVKIREWARKGHGVLRYESWYSAGNVKERLLEDDRVISYNAFYRSGQKWQEYLYNKQKRLRAFYEYDRNGKLVR